MKPTRILSLTLMLLAALPALAQAQQTVWRCGADGKTYSDVPCTEGRSLDVAQAPRPEADVRVAQQRAAREQALANSMTHERLQREAAMRGSGLGGFTSTPQAKVAVRSKGLPAPHHKRRPAASPVPADADTWRAVAPASRRGRG